MVSHLESGRARIESPLRSKKSFLMIVLQKSDKSTAAAAKGRTLENESKAPENEMMKVSYPD